MPDMQHDLSLLACEEGIIVREMKRAPDSAYGCFDAAVNVLVDGQDAMEAARRLADRLRYLADRIDQVTGAERARRLADFDPPGDREHTVGDAIGLRRLP